MAIRASKDQLFGKPVPPGDDLLSAVGINVTSPHPPTQTRARARARARNSPTSRLETNHTVKDQTPDGTKFTSYYKNITWTIFTDYCINGLDALENGKSLPTAPLAINSQLIRRSTRRAVSKLLSYQREDTD
jgi:hypothetical protein